MADTTKVFFKRGQQASIETLKQNTANIVDGSFYLTEDTHRLYVGQGNSLVLLNQTVQFIDSLTALYDMSSSWTAAEKAAHVNDIYYVKPSITADSYSGNTAPYGNILAVWTVTGTNTYAWTQINPNTDTKVESFTSSVSAAGNVATVKNAVTSGGQGFEDSIKISAGKKDNVATVNIVSANGDEVIITGDTYTLTVDASDNKASFTLASALGQESSVVKIVAGTNVSVVKNASGEIVVSSEKWVPTTAGGSSLSLQSDGKLKLALSDGDTTLEIKSDVLGYTVGGETVALGDTLDVYTKDEVKKIINELNGMAYKGTISDINLTYATVYKIKSDGTITKDEAAADLHAGDMFLVAGSNVTVNGSEAARPGDLIIAGGTENSDGVIVSGLNWAIVPSGDTTITDTTYTFTADANSNKLNIVCQNDGVGEAAGSITLKDIDTNPVQVTSEATDGKHLVTTVAHSTISVSKPEAAEQAVASSNGRYNITAIEDITFDNYGHLKTVVPKTFVLPDYSLGVRTSSGIITGTSTNYGEINSDLVIDDTDISSTSKMMVTSDTLKISHSTDANSNPTINLDLEWGTF